MYKIHTRDFVMTLQYFSKKVEPIITRKKIQFDMSLEGHFVLGTKLILAQVWLTKLKLSMETDAS